LLLALKPKLTQALYPQTSFPSLLEKKFRATKALNNLDSDESDADEKARIRMIGKLKGQANSTKGHMIYQRALG
jgi:hypothetical protein